ncbi:MAG TPA: thymidine phosphorylase [Terracidiphilus sp.]|jgi:pyrimidine-nucleoside phosphorylase|nr:thymidine phosphorylase [Terracidiphilus sp.]
MPSDTELPIHMVDLIRRKRDGGTLTERQINFLVAGATSGSIPREQLAAWLMAVCVRGLSRQETQALTLAMRDSGERFDPSHLGRPVVDKHSTGGVGDKTSLIIAPVAAACGLAVPMISGRGLGHSGGTLDKLESIPGYRTSLSLAEFESVLRLCGASMIGQTPSLAPADRVLYALRDLTGTVENPGLICASILSKKLAAGLDALVLDVKTGSGSFLRDRQACENLAALLVATAEAAGTRTVALLTDMDQPLSQTAGNWIEVAECVRLLRGEHPEGAEDVLHLSLVLAGWMIHLGGKAPTPAAGEAMAAAALADGSALAVFYKMVDAHGGDVSVFEDLDDQQDAFHKPGAIHVLGAWETGYVSRMDTTGLGWAVQRTGAGRLHAGEQVDPHAGIRFHARLGTHVQAGRPLATVYATNHDMLVEPLGILLQSIEIAPEPPPANPLISRLFTRDSAEAHLANAVR